MRGLSLCISIGMPVLPSLQIVPWSHVRAAFGPVCVTIALHDLDRLFWSMATKLKKTQRG